MYNPVGVDNAKEICEVGRIVSVGFDSEFEDEDMGVIEERNIGQSIIAMLNVFNKNGKYVNLAYFACSGT